MADVITGGKCRVNGTDYAVTGGTCQIGGASYPIIEGKTRVDGTEYDITFAQISKLTVTLYCNYMYIFIDIIINGTQSYRLYGDEGSYIVDRVIDVKIGDTVAVGSNGGGCVPSSGSEYGFTNVRYTDESFEGVVSQTRCGVEFEQL